MEARGEVGNRGGGGEGVRVNSSEGGGLRAIGRGGRGGGGEKL